MNFIPIEQLQIVADGFYPDDTGVYLVRRDSTPPCAEYDAAARQIERLASEAYQLLPDYWQMLRMKLTENKQ